MRGLLKVVVLMAVAGAGFSLFFTARKGVESDLFALIPANGAEEMRAATAMTANLARFLVKADSEEAARARLAELGVVGFGSPSAARGFQSSIELKTLAPYARGFLSPTVRRQLERGEFAAVRDAAAARLFSPIPPILPPTQDPFLLFTDYVLEMSAPKGEWVMVCAMLTPDEALSALAAVREADDVRCAGAPFHTAVASARSKREINILSGISLFCVILFGWLLTRSFRFLGVLTILLAAAFCVAAAALFALFPKPHLMTFVFGTTLIGLSVDYVYHALSARGSIEKPLTFSFFSTVACFLPLLLSGVGVLNQMAVFTVAGLATVYVSVMVYGGGKRSALKTEKVSGGVSGCSGEACWREGEGHSGRRAYFRLAAYVLFVLCIVGIVRLRFDNDLSRFHRPDPYLAEGERMAVAMSGGEGFLPSGKTQLHNAELVMRLYAAEGMNYCKMTGLPESVLEMVAVFRKFDPKGALEGVFARLTRNLRVILLLTYGVVGFLMYCLLVFRRDGGASCFYSASTAAFASVGLLGWIGEPMTFFNLLCVFIFFGLGLDYSIFTWHSRHRHSFGLHSLSLTSSSGGAQMALETSEQSPDIHSLALTSSSGGATERTVLFSFLTSFVGFGLLAFTDFAVTRSMGVTLAIGLAFSYLAAKVFCGGGSGVGVSQLTTARAPSPHRKMPGVGLALPREGEADGRGLPRGGRADGQGLLRGDGAGDCAWHEQKEQCASLFWAQFMWYSYAWFGKTFQKIIFVIGMPVIYLFAKPSRCALAKFYGVLSTHTGQPYPATHGRLFRHLLGFAWGVMDKTDASTLKKNLPVMTVRDDAGWRAFKATMDAQKGAFIFCTHVGVVGVMPALPESLGLQRIPKVHAFQQMGHTAVFMKVFMKHFNPSRIEMHAVEEIGVETAVAMQEAIGRGELVIMAGDRTSAGSKSVLHHRFLGRDCVWPKGAFRFAALMESPMFAVTCIRTGWNRYEVHIAEIGVASPLEDFVTFLEAETVAHPEQWYQFYDFFGEKND